MAGKDFGGTMKFRDSSGRNVTLRGNFTIFPANASIEAVVNQDGSADRVATPTAPRAEISFADKGIDLAAMMGDERRDVTITEEFTGVAHLFTQAFYTGDPQSNRLNGEVTGVGITGAVYRKIG
ncbi:phage tail tube protein [Mesorhizobium sp. KR2-14]|uniref:phage tail tube protein n=1 Tax=Mesorhizobium sp. KR2-14 TaxID=3156610 RepID=UPI0032B5E3F5